MRIQDNPPLHLTYCLNVHPGEGWGENFAAIREHAARVRDRVAGGRAFGLGLRLSRRAAGELAEPAALDEFRRFLDREGMYVFTVNAFPYGAFHGRAVKRDVYRPDWRTSERRDYTNAVADILAALLPEGVGGSISTVPVSYAAWMASPEDVRQAAAMLAATAEHLARLRDRTGRDVCLALEPEPDCHLENTEQTVAFFERLPAATRRHVGVCLDTAHLAVQFEDPAEAARRLTGAGVRIAKVQLSAALAVRPTPVARRRLRAFCDPVYLHQVKARRPDGSLTAWPDLADALDWPPPAEPAAEEWRIHFHVPLFFTGDADLSSTAPLPGGEFAALLRRGLTEHLEIETYTFAVLPDSMRVPDIADAIAREYQWVMERLLGR